MVEATEDEAWILGRVPKKVTALILIYSGSRDGWDVKEFHEACDEMGPTLTVIKTKGGATCGGFTMLDWNS